MEHPRGREPFRTTSWTLIEALADPDHDRHEAALDALVRRYWPPVYGHLCLKYRSRDLAAEQTQAFFADVVLGRRLFHRADAHRGRLRTLLLTALQNYEIGEHRKRVVRRMDSQVPLDNLEREEAFLSREQPSAPAEVFERRWAVATLEEAVERCRRHFTEKEGKPDHWNIFEAFAVRPAVHGCERPRLDDLISEFGFPTAVHASSAMKVVRKHLLLLLREVVAETAGQPADQDDEYQCIVDLLS